jgi:hypothetical protein
MAGEKFLQLQSGKAATVTSVQTGGSGKENKIPSLDAAGKLDITMMPTGIGADTITAEASEALVAGNFVNLFLDTTLKVRKADATAAGKEANGFVLASFDSAAIATVYRQGDNNQLTGMTLCARQYLSEASPGARTETAPSATGNVVQFLGLATSETTLFFEERDTIIA